ncbi:MAG: sigma-54-dependent transcriptional regulator [Planctomycetota bacterium]
MPARILVADDEPAVRASIASLCHALGHETFEADNAERTLAAIAQALPDIVLLDFVLPDRSGLEILPEIVARPSAPAVIAVTGLSEIATAVAAMRAGAADYLQKPVQLTTLDAAISRILKSRVLREERDRLRDELARLRAGAILGGSPEIRAVVESVARVAATPRTTVLITGESGVGKELVAHAVHEQSARAAEPFVAVNCAALSESLLEAELFGYEGGSFTGAASKGRTGLIAAAEGGALFLDEIGELALDLQAKLLRVLQERVYRPVGSVADRAMDVRILASTNRDLVTMVEGGGFREDLYYRLNVLSIRVPPLRERPSDVPVLAAHFLAHFEREFGKAFDGFSSAAREALVRHDWPGNVRELRNAIERAALLAAGGEIQPAHLFASGTPPFAARTASLLDLPQGERSLAAMERAWILRVLQASNGNRSHAARLLGVNRTTLYNKLKSYGVE